MKKAATVMIFLCAALGNLYAQAPTQPTLPQKTVSLTPPTQGTSTCPTLTTGSNCIRKVPSGDATSFQNAINASTCGDTIVLVAGSTYSGNFTIPSTSCSGWIEIVSSALASLPPSGNRVAPSNVSNMPTISTPNTSSALEFLPNSNHWRLIGLEITTSYVSTSRVIYYLVATGESLAVQAQLPAYLVFDRIYIHGLSTTNTQHGIGMDTQSIGIVDSDCDEIHYNGNDSQCFFSYNGSGPFLIQNNFIQAAGENIMFGGNDPSITNLVSSDITVVGNLIQKNLAWDGEEAPYNWVVKNHFELKNAQRVLLDGNVLQYTWAAGQDVSVVLRGVNQGGRCGWCVVQDVTVTHNIIQHAPDGFVIADPDTQYAAQTTARILIQNNVLTDISETNWGAGHGWAFYIAIDNDLAPEPLQNIIIDHDTVFVDMQDIYIGDTGTVQRLQMTNDIFQRGSIGGVAAVGMSEGTPSLTSSYVSSYVWEGMAFITPTGSSFGTYPSGTFWSTLASVDFTSITGTSPDFSGNFQLKSSSPYYQAGTDGKDIGVWDWACLNNDSTAALTGRFVPSNGCAMSGNLPPQPPSNLTATVN